MAKKPNPFAKGKAAPFGKGKPPAPDAAGGGGMPPFMKKGGKVKK